MTVPPAAAQSLGMAMHELATNAVKYGSLSNHTGRVEVSWSVAENTFHIRWREIGGPTVAAPGKAGFGTILLDQMTASSLSGDVTIEYAPDVIIWQLQCPLSVLQDNPGKSK